MNSTNENPFAKFQAQCEKGDLETALDELSEYLVRQSRYHELFEVRKLQLRNRLGLSVGQWQPIDTLPNDAGKALEDGLLDICREIGTAIMRQGDVAAGWQYLEPVGDRVMVAKLLSDVELSDENVEAFIQIAAGQAVAPELGFQAVLDRFGTCSSITTYESMLAGHPIEVRRGPARLLVEHLYNELSERIRSTISEKEEVDEQTLASHSILELISGREWLFEGLGHHIDTTHLASTVRIAKILEGRDALGKAIELAEYGIRLHSDFQYKGQSPFEDTYCDTRDFLLAVRNPKEPVANDVVERLKLAAEQDQSHYLDCAAWYVHLLHRLGREDAVVAYLELIHEQQTDRVISEDVCPNLMTLLERHGGHQLAAEHLRKAGDLLTFATVVSSQSD